MASSDSMLHIQSTVYVSDYDTLGDGKWLNDTIIGFAYDVFANKTFVDSSQNTFLFLHPTTVNVIKFENDKKDLVPLIKDAGISSYDYIFFPINNSQSMFSVSGSHWALMIYQRHNNTFYYADSAGTYNLTYAKKMANKVYPYIDIKKDNQDKDDKDEEKKQDTNNNDNDDDDDVDYIKILNNFVRLQVPQQENNYDCGMYVVEFTRFVAKYYTDNFKNDDKDKDKDKQYPCVSKTNFFKDKDMFDAHSIVEMRKNWRQTINDMSNETDKKRNNQKMNIIM